MIVTDRLLFHVDLVDLGARVQPGLVDADTDGGATLVTRVAKHVGDAQEQPKLPLLVSLSGKLEARRRDLGRRRIPASTHERRRARRARSQGPYRGLCDGRDFGVARVRGRLRGRCSRALRTLSPATRRARRGSLAARRAVAEARREACIGRRGPPSSGPCAPWRVGRASAVGQA